MNGVPIQQQVKGLKNTGLLVENYKKNKPPKQVIEREYYVSKVLPAEVLAQRWDKINFDKKLLLNIQLTFEL